MKYHRRARVLWAAGIVVAAGALVLFPFDWLADVWPAYGRLFDVVFASVQAHQIGHAMLFFLAGLLVLVALPVLQRYPARYFGLLLAGAIAEEGVQSVAKLHLPTIWDGRDLLLDCIGLTVAYLVAYLLLHLSRAITTGDSPPEGRARG